MISWDELWMGLPYVLAITSRVSIPVSLPSLPISRQNKAKAMLWTHRLAWRTEIFSSCLCVTELELHFYCLVCTVWGQAGHFSVRVTHLAEQVIHWRAELFRQIPCTSQAFVSHMLMQLICYFFAMHTWIFPRILTYGWIPKFWHQRQIPKSSPPSQLSLFPLLSSRFLILEPEGE